MARRKKTSPAEDLVELVALLPWWVCVALALLSYLLLHRLAAQPASAPVDLAQMSTVFAHSALRGLAMVGQYALPTICLLAAGVSAWRRKVRRSLVADVVQSQASDVLEGISWREFELLVGEGFRQQGFQVVESGGGGPDGGVDLVLTKPGKNGSERLLVQCKQWRAFKVGVDVVRELYGVMAARGAAGGFVVTSGRFTDEAVGFASGRNVTLIDGPKLHGLLRQAKTAADSSPARPLASPPVQRGAAPTQSASCPLCSQPMVRRTAKRGANAGSAFWGCTGYPACRGTRPIA